MDSKVSAEAIAVDAAVRISAHSHVAEVAPVIAEIGPAQYAFFVMTLKNGQRFKLTVEEAA